MVSRITNREEAQLFLLMYVKRSFPVDDEPAVGLTASFVMGMEFAFAVPEYARALMLLMPTEGQEECANAARRAADLFPVEVA